MHPHAAPERDAVQLHDDEQGPSEEQLQQAELLRKRLIYGIGAVPAVASVLGLLGWLWWPFHAMDLFRVQYTALLVVMIALALWVKQWKAAGLFLLPILLNVVLVAPLFLPPQAAQSLQWRGYLSASHAPAQMQPTSPRSADYQVTPAAAGALSETQQLAAAERAAQSSTPDSAAASGNADADADEVAGDGQAIVPNHAGLFQDVPFPEQVDPARLKASFGVLLYLCSETAPEADAPYEFLRSSTADLLVLQNVTPDWVDPLRWRVAPFRVHKSAARGGQYGQAILGRFHYAPDDPTIGLKSRQLSLLPGRYVPAFESVVTLQQGKVAVLSLTVPLPLRSDAAEQHDLLMQMISHWVRRQTLPVVVVGSLGTTPWSSSFQNLLADTGLVNSQVGHGLQATWPARGGLPFGGIPIDHVLHSPQVKVIQRDLLPAVHSDHHALQVQLTLDPEAVSYQVEPEQPAFDNGQQARGPVFRH